MAPKRRPPGIPTGGQFAACAHEESDLVLDPGLVPTRTGDDDNFDWRLPDGNLHRDDGPAMQRHGGVDSGRKRRWLKTRKQAVEESTRRGNEYWYQYGHLHRVDGPAAQHGGGLAAGGVEEWYLDGKRHRVGGPAQQWGGGLAAGGREVWWEHGRPHRVGGPAAQVSGGVAAGGDEFWYHNGRLHRDPQDGPAITTRDGTVEYWVDGTQVPPPGPGV